MSVNKTPSAEQLYILLARAEREGLGASVVERLKIILHFAEHHYSISETCRQFGISRSTFHRWMERFNPHDLSTLADKSHEPMNPRQSAIEAETIELIRRYRTRYPQMGKERIAELLFRDHASDISASSVGRIIDRECLFFADTPLHWKKRMEHQRKTVDLTTNPSPLTESGETSSEVFVMPQVPPSPRKEKMLGDEVMIWKSMKRFVIVSSIVTNLAFLGLLVGMAFFERTNDVPMEPTNIEIEQHEVLHAAPPQVYIP